MDFVLYTNNLLYGEIVIVEAIFVVTFTTIMDANSSYLGLNMQDK